jgi:hypothetical protein
MIILHPSELAAKEAEKRFTDDAKHAPQNPVPVLGHPMSTAGAGQCPTCKGNKFIWIGSTNEKQDCPECVKTQSSSY